MSKRIPIHWMYWLFLMVASVLLIFPIWWLFRAALEKRCVESGVTHAKGVLFRKSKRITRVEGVTVDRNIIGMLFGFGSITVSGTGGKEIRIGMVPSVNRWAAEIEKCEDWKYQAVAV